MNFCRLQPWVRQELGAYPRRPVRSHPHRPGGDEAGDVFGQFPLRPAVLKESSEHQTGGEDGPLLTAAGREAEHIVPGERREPVPGDGRCWGEDDRPLAPASGRSHLRPDRNRPPVAGTHLSVPGIAVMDANVHRFPKPNA